MPSFPPSPCIPLSLADSRSCDNAVSQCCLLSLLCHSQEKRDSHLSSSYVGCNSLSAIVGRASTYRSSLHTIVRGSELVLHGDDGIFFEKTLTESVGEPHVLNSCPPGDRFARAHGQHPTEKRLRRQRGVWSSA